MRPVRSLFVCLVTVVLVHFSAHSAAAGCKKSLTMREVPGGEPQPAHLIECDESERPALLEQNAHLRVCDPKALAEVGGFQVQRRTADRFLEAHEVGGADSAAEQARDLANGRFGLGIGFVSHGRTDSQLADRVFEELQSGNLK